MYGDSSELRAGAVCMNKNDKPRSIEEYIESAPETAQIRLREMLKCLRKAAPDAKEAIKWGSPALSYDTILFIFAAYKKHVSLFPTPPVIEAFSNDLKEFKTSSSTIQFPLDKPLPIDLIEKLANYRIQRVLEDGATWM